MVEEWKVVTGYYPGFLEIVGASFNVSVVTDATDLTLDDHIARVRDAHIMAAGKDMLEALESLVTNADRALFSDGQYDMARAAIAKAQGKV